MKPDIKSGASSMKKLIPVAAVVAAIVSLWATLPAFAPRDLGTAEAIVYARTAQMLNATVRIELTQGSGSGTVLHSSDKGTFIVTNHHVAGEKGNTVQARFWITNRKGETVLSVLRDAKVVASDATRDLALLRLEDSEFRAEAVAALAPENMPLHVGEAVWVAGSAMGLRAHLTTGLLSVLSHTVMRAPHIVTSAPVIMGNSGGSLNVLRNGRYLYIGTVRAVAAVGFGSPVVTTNYSVPNESLREFLKGAEFGWIAG